MMPFMQTAETKTCKTNILFKDANIAGKTIEENVKGVINLPNQGTGTVLTFRGGRGTREASTGAFAYHSS